MAETSTWTPSGGVLFGCSIGVTLVALALMFKFFQRRRLQPIRSRFWWQPLLLSAWVLAGVVTFTLAVDFEPSCERLALSAFAGFSSILVLFIRTIHVLAAYEMSRLVSDNYEIDDEEERKRNLNTCFANHAPMIQSFRFQTVVFLALSSMNASFLFMTSFLGNCGVVDILPLIFISSPYAISVLYLGCRIRTDRDGIFLKRELLVSGLIYICAYITFFIIRAFGHYEEAAIFLSFASLSLIIIFIWYPLHISYVWQAQNKFFEGDSKLSSDLFDDSGHSGHGEIEFDKATGAFRLIDILKEKQGYIVFKEFCRLELNHENPIFFSQCSKLLHKYKQLAKYESALQKDCKRLYDTFIKDGAALPLNLSGEVSETFKALGLDEEKEADLDAAHHAFFIARQEIYHLMRRDPYVRFIKSKLYKEYEFIKLNGQLVV